MRRIPPIFGVLLGLFCGACAYLFLSSTRFTTRTVALGVGTIVSIALILLTLILQVTPYTLRPADGETRGRHAYAPVAPCPPDEEPDGGEGAHN